MAMVDAIVTSLVNTVSQLLAQETHLILNATDQVESLQDELKFIKAFLRLHSEGKRDEVREEVKQIHDVVLEAEDLLDDFVIKRAQYKRRNWLMRFFHLWEKIVLLRNVGVNIERINIKLKKIHQNKDKYNIRNNEDVSERDRIESRRRNVEEDEVVSFDKDAEQVIEKLNVQDLRRDVISIVGMGGLGKTTLAKKIYNSSFVKQSFDCRAWVGVSQDYNRKGLLMKIAEAVFPSTEMVEADKLTEDNLVQKLSTELEGNRYMIVLDDVWDKHLWDGIKAAFPDNSNRSRVLITSRLKEVASHASVRTSPYFLPLLNEDDSWKLFSKKVFHDQVCPPSLEQLARQQILPKCKGLPLAIVVAAGLLRDREESMWSKVASGLNWYLAQDPTECLGILALSYDDLPPHLKSCFLYFGVYPEDFDIPVRELIRLWCAEGFIDEENANLDMEDVAEEYLLQLIDRSLIQVGRRRSDGGVKSCRIHDLLRDLSISEGKKEKFLVVDTMGDGSSLRSNKSFRRLSVHLGIRDFMYDYLYVPEFSRLRSLLYFGDKALDDYPFGRLSKFCPYLRVLDTGSAIRYEFPPNVEMLVQLRYLKVKSRNIGLIPPLKSKLENLQTLHLESLYEDRYLYVSNIKIFKIWKMQQLRHLLLPFDYTIRLKIPKGNGKSNSILPNVRTLSTLGISKHDDVNMLETFPNLKKLHALCCEQELQVFEYVSNLQCLQTLKIRGPFKFTDAGALPLSLTKITLQYTHLDISAFEKLGALQNLQVLKLRSESLKGRKLEYYSDQGRFPRLQVLHIHGLEHLEWWSMEGQGLQSLVYLSIDGCFRLKSIPAQLKQISTLRQLKVTGICHDDLKESLNQIWVNDPQLIFSRQ